MTYRTFAWIALATLAAGGTATTAFGGKWINQFGRYFGYGISDGYHATRPEAGGDSILVAPGRVENYAPAPTPAPAAEPSKEPIELPRDLVPKAPPVTGLPSRMMSPSPSTTEETPSRGRQPRQVLGRFRGKERKPGEPEQPGLTAPDVEGPSLNIDGPGLAPSAVPAADGSIDPYPEAPPASRSPIAVPSANPTSWRSRYLPPPR